MKNPLNARLPRELKQDKGKYIALFLFLVLTIGFVSGFLVADNSMTTTYYDGFDKYNIEDGHFTLAKEADDSLIDKLENKDVSIYKLFYKDIVLKNENTIRIYKNRDDVNKVCLMDGTMPTKNDEIVIDRLYAENNDIKIGDLIKLNDDSFKVTGFVALSDYSALFKNNTDMMLDANRFSVSIVTDEAYENIVCSNEKYNYAWTYNNKNLSEKKSNEKGDEVLDIIKETKLVTDFVKVEENSAIKFTGEDMGSDKSMITWLLYVVIVVLAFVFGITTKSTIEQEASVVGTLRASGYKRGELLIHYLALPTIVTLVAAIMGNIIGYTFMKNYCAGMYYHSYSLPTYKTIWNMEAFIKTTVIPCIIILLVNVLILWRTLSLSPLKFLRHDLTRNKKTKVMKLPNWKFISRFRTRIILQNIPAYITLFIGIVFASILLIFGMIMTPILKEFKEDVENSNIANYQYVLKAPVELDDDSVEKYCVTSLNIPDGEEVTVFGIDKASKYLKNLDLPTGKSEVIVSTGYLEKYGLNVGDTITLDKKYEDKEHKFIIKAKYDYAASLAVFMNRDEFNKEFDNSADFFNGYFSDKKIKDINDAYIATIITSEDLTVVANQLDDSMGFLFPMVGGFSMLLYILLMYLLAKLIVEKNSQSVSMIKILGYSDKEASKLYNSSTAIVVGLSLVISLPISYLAMKGIYYVFMKEINGWITFYLAPWIFPTMLLIGMACYFIVHIIQMGKIRKIPMAQALKNVE